MSIRWQKEAPGIYVTDTGRFAIHKNGAQGWQGKMPEWVVTDGGAAIASCASLKAGKKYVDDVLELEAKANA